MVLKNKGPVPAPAGSRTNAPSGRTARRHASGATCLSLNSISSLEARAATSWAPRAYARSALAARTIGSERRYWALCEAASIASTRSREEKGLERYATHPALNAARRVTSSSRPVMNMTGGEIPMSVNLRLSSMPQTPFKLMSSTRQAASRRFARSIKLSTVEKVSTSNPRTLSSRSTAPRTLLSSSRTSIALRKSMMLGGAASCCWFRWYQPFAGLSDGRSSVELKSAYLPTTGGPFNCP